MGVFKTIVSLEAFQYSLFTFPPKTYTVSTTNSSGAVISNKMFDTSVVELIQSPALPTRSVKQI